MSVVLRCAGTDAPPFAGDPSGAWLASFDPEAHEGYGEVVFTLIPARIMRFADAAQAMEYIRQVPRARPVRGDGKPNRPLTAYTWQVEEAPVE